MTRAKAAREEPKNTSRAPTGTVAFLFTDIEGSSQRWEAHPDVMDGALRRHDAILTSAIATHNGHVFKTAGDEFCVAFGRISDAIRAAIDAQRTLSQEDFSAVGGLRVRMGLHLGEATEHDGDYFGPVVNRVARLMSIGHGGQILITDVARAHVHGDLPDGVSLTDFGPHQLKGLAEPEHVWQLTIAGLNASFPPLKSLDPLLNNLPMQVTSFRGRERDLKEVKSLLGAHRLLTLFGAGGVGKTRLAVQAGADLLEQHPDGVWFADLAPISSGELVPSVIAKMLGISQPEDRRVDDSILVWLKRKRLLLILDNCEHLLDTVATLADAILRSCPDVRILATSRQALGITGEAVHRLPSLALPETTAGLSAESAMGYGAIALFADRARASDSRFALADDVVPIVTEICRRLDGIPLAIELAAARVKVLSLSGLAQHLDERFKILTAGSRTALPRQKTLTALIYWSYDLLSSREQTLFQRCSIFAGGFTLDAATAVCGGDEVADDDVLDLVISLVDKSLMLAETDAESERYNLLESTRAYALEKLAENGGRERVAGRHAAYFIEVARAHDQVHSPLSMAAWIARAEVDLDNFRAALEWALKEGHDIALGGALAGALERVWFGGGLSAEGRWWIQAALERTDQAEHPAIVARLRRGLAMLSTGRRSYDSARQALALYEELKDRHGAAQATGSLAWSLIEMGRLDEAAAANERALATLTEFADSRGVASALWLQGWISGDRGDLPTARELYGRALTEFRALRDDSGVAAVLTGLAELEFQQRNAEHALRYASEALELEVRGKNATNIANNHNNIAAYCIALGNLERASREARDGLAWAQKVQGATQITWACQHLALIAALRAQAPLAARLLGFVDARLEELGCERGLTERWSSEKLLASLREQLADTEMRKLAAEGGAWSEERAADEARKGGT
jgi:predicted ATPase/class 3 adenylate cyclase